MNLLEKVLEWAIIIIVVGGVVGFLRGLYIILK
jgi:hypothetical protein